MPDNTNMENETSKLYNPSNRSTEQILDSIDRKFEWLLKNGSNISASNARNIYGKSNSTFYQDLRRNRGYGSASRDFSTELRKTLNEELFGATFKKSLNQIRDQLAKDLGVELGDLPKELGKQAGKILADRLKQTKLGKSLTDAVNQYTDNLTKKFKDAYARGSNPFRPKGSKAFDSRQWSGNASMPDISDALSSTLSNEVKGALGDGAAESIIEGAGEISAASGGAGAALKGLGEVASTMGPELLAAGAATGGLLIGLDLVTGYLKKKLKPVLEASAVLIKQFNETLARESKSREKNLELSRKRLDADIHTLVEAPFKILEQAAQAWYETWDSTLRTISATQGYNKNEIMELYASFVDRLRRDELTDVIGATDIVNNLQNVLQAGLQGAAAEEFAYLATILNAAIPTQDFFNYTEGYITAVSNAMKQGKSQEQALKIANEELEAFANNLLYAGRELSGGFATGLKNADTLFAKAEKIAQAGRAESGSALGAVLASVSAVTGATAPDLAQSITDVLYSAAVGGNASELVALRSLAGINASNTEFLREIVKNPQKVFGDLFEKLGEMQNMANGAYMEVAEGLSGIFGISLETLARVDFDELAEAIRASTESSASLSQNMNLLRSGETTTNAEMLKYAQMEKFIVDEGLGYVIDSEQGRLFLQHEWDEQMNRQLMEATYGVELQGTALSLLEKISGFVQGIKNLVSPSAWFTKATELVTTMTQESALKGDIAQVLLMSQVGAGNAKALQQLLTYNADLNVVPNLVELLGGRSAYRQTQGIISATRSTGFANDIYAASDAYAHIHYFDNMFTSDEYTGQLASAAASRNRVSSDYTWSRVGKSILDSYSGAIESYADKVAVTAAATAATSQSQSHLVGNMQKMLDSMDEFYAEDNTRTFEDFVATKGKFGIQDFEKAVEESGLTEEAIRNRYMDLQTKSESKAKAEREGREEDFWNNSLLQFTKSNAWLESINSTATNIYNIFDKYLGEWEDYFIKHTVYNNAYTRDSVQKVLDAEKESSETAIYALADALTQNDVSLLVDPTMQTNALLAQILKVANAILNQNNSGIGGVSLPDTLAGLSLGIINTQ